MKNSNVKYVIVTLIFMVGVVSISFYSCEKEDVTPFEPVVDNTSGVESKATQDNGYIPPENYCGKIQYNHILNDSGKEVGESYSYNDSKFFYLLLLANDGYAFKNAYLHVAKQSDLIPMNEDGNPDYLNFQHYLKAEEADLRRMFKIPVSQFSGKSVVAAMTEFRSTNTDESKYEQAWVGLRQFGNTLPGRAFLFEKGVCRIDQPAQDFVDE